MNTAQFLAADPKANAWVVASAGTGKTKVLTDRILNILLQGFVPEKILCLTFTKAAAAEMGNRLMKRLALWVTLAEGDLRQELEGLMGDISVSPATLRRARELFSLVLDTPGGMKIQTIHGFCQSILGRFPLEAGIPPHFQILDEFLSDDILLESQDFIFAKPSHHVELALEILCPYMADQRFSSILKDVYGHRSRVDALLAKYDNFNNYVHCLVSFLGVDNIVVTAEELLVPNLLLQVKNDSVPENVDFDTYISTYLTQNGEIRKKLSPEQALEAERAFQLNQTVSALEIAQRSVAVLVLYKEIMTEYEAQKVRRGALDYDDLIQKTQKLLTQPDIAAWVLYKLDGGIDHLLIDEAQDTNVAQWDIILSLTSEFFTSGNTNRTIFAVGDPKQSIYSFQGANPEDFLKLKDHFADRIQAIGQTWRDVQLDLSYRSTAAILGIVDEVFTHSQTKQGVSFGQNQMIHHVFREHLDEHCSEVMVWPLIEAKDEVKEAETGEWQLPVKRAEHQSPEYRLAQYLADNVVSWIRSKDILPSTDQPIQPRDILILVRKRSVLGDEVIRALKKRDIPVAGSDRLVLTDHIAVMDLLALGQFVLLPDDDLNLACVLRSPLIGMSEEELYSLAHGREGSLWASLAGRANEHSSFEKAHSWLTSCMYESDRSLVYEFYHWVLVEGEGRRRIFSRLGQEAEDVLEEFLTQCLIYDQEYTSSLQGFVHYMNHQSQEIKRDSSDSLHNQVRLMTIHGAKGLQAPIVILLDAAERGKEKVDPLLWGDNLMMLRPSQRQDTTKTRLLKHKCKQLELEEKNRLLYVALTRAQDRLYVGGWTSGKEVAEDSWYCLIQNAVKLRANTRKMNHPSIQQDDRLDLKQHEKYINSVQLPQWAFHKPIDRIYERGQFPEKEIRSNKAVERGIILHRLFECLPQFPEDSRYVVACQILAKEGLSICNWEDDIHQVLNILCNPEFSSLFGQESLAEVPICGIMDDAPFQGRIDRLVVTDNTITIIDYKTNRDPPKRLEDIPKEYIRQLDGYARALKSLYPSHEVRKLLLWTAGPMIQRV